MTNFLVYDVFTDAAFGGNPLAIIPDASGLPEYPEIGSAAAALAVYLGRLDGQSATFTITQGVEMGRPSRITAEVTVDRGAPIAVSIEGQAIRVMEGRLTF